MIQLDLAQIAKMIDHTLLKADATEEQIDHLCAEARQYEFGAVCVNPVWVVRCVQQLEGTDVEVCTVVGFPLGANLSRVKQFETEQALTDGATEIDMVINIGALKSGRASHVQDEISQIAQLCHDQGAICKVIIETSLLSEEEKVLACRLVTEAGADFVKTSTGFGPGGATVSDVALMRRTVGPDMGIKAAGGIRTFETARQMIAAGATRIGASAGTKILKEARDIGYQ
jgi:deoxyribose-phosphate aldolase